MADKRVIEQPASSELYNDDWFLKDSVLEGTTKISKDNLIDKIGASKIKSIAEDYDSTSTYNKDDFAFYENKLYRCLANNTTGTWDATKWEEFDLPTALITTAHNIETAEFTIGTYYSADDLVLKDGKLYQCVVFHNATEWKPQFWNVVTIDEMLEYISNSIALEHNQSTVYAVGDLVMHNKALWRCIQAGAGAFVNANWELVTVADLIAEAGQIDDVQVKTTGDYETVVENKIAKIDLSSVTAYGSVSNLPQAIATFKDGADAPMKSLKVAIEPQQDLHGYDSPWVGGAGKNKLPMTVDGIKAVNTYHSWSGNSTTINNVTITIETDSVGNVTGIRFNGTASADITFNLASNITISNGSYIWSNDQTVNISNLWLSLTSPNIAITLSTQKEVNITVSNDSIGSAYIYASSGNVFNNIVFKPMIRLASVSDSTFAPYSNICPISGWDEANVTRTGKNLWNNNWSAYTQPSDYRICPIKLENGQYTASVKLKEGGTRQSGFTLGIAKQGDRYTNFGSFYTASTGADKTGTITVDDAWTAPKLIVYCSNESAFNAIFENYEIQLELGTTATTYEPYAGNTYTIDLDGTRYDGEVDVVSGVMTVDRVGVDLSSVSFTYDSSNKRWSRQFSDMKNYTARSADLMFEQYQATTSAYTGDTGTAFAYGQNIYIYDAEQSLTISGKCVYELATPLTIQLTPTQVKSLLGSNNVWADTGDVLDAEYVRDATATINDILARLEALEG